MSGWNLGVIFWEFLVLGEIGVDLGIPGWNLGGISGFLGGNIGENLGIFFGGFGGRPESNLPPLPAAFHGAGFGISAWETTASLTWKCPP